MRDQKEGLKGGIKRRDQKGTLVPFIGTCCLARSSSCTPPP